jgi:hypothetical protein
MTTRLSIRHSCSAKRITTAARGKSLAPDFSVVLFNGLQVQPADGLWTETEKRACNEQMVSVATEILNQER